MTWEEICADPILADLPFRIESDRWGNVVLSPPPGADHSDYQAEILLGLAHLLPKGLPRSEYPLQTNQGVKGVDVVWVSKDRHSQKPPTSTVHLIAPEICVEVLSPSNTTAEMNEKILLYFERGAQECWTCDGSGKMTFFDPTGVIKRSKLCPRFPAQIKKS